MTFPSRRQQGEPMVVTTYDGSIHLIDYQRYVPVALIRHAHGFFSFYPFHLDVVILTVLLLFLLSFHRRC